MTQHVEKLSQTAVALIRQYQLLESLVRQRDSRLSDFEATKHSRESGFKGVFDLYNYVFASLDSIVRFHKMAHSLPAISKKEPIYRALDEKAAHFKDARNQIQHLNNDVMNGFSGPLMGSIAWPRGKKCHFITFNDIGRERTAPSLVFDTAEDQFVQGFSYIYNDIYYDIDKASEAIQEFYSALMERLVLKVGDSDFDPLSNIAVLQYEFRRQ